MNVKLSQLKPSTIWSICLLIGGYITLQLITDVTVAKMVTLFGISVPAGSLLYAVTFTWRDVLHKRLGISWSRAAIVLAAVFNIVMALWFVATIYLPPAGFWTNQEAYASTLGIMPRVVAASIAVEVIAELTDTHLYHLVERRFQGRWQFMRVVISNGVSGPLDGFLFGLLAFGGTMPLSALWQIIWGGMAFKLVIGYAVIPLIYLVREGRLEAGLPAAQFAGAGD